MLEAELAAAASTSDQRDRVNIYNSLSGRLVQRGDAQGIIAAFAHMTAEDVPLVVSRQSAVYLARALSESSLSEADPEGFVNITESCLSCINRQALPCDDAEFLLRDNLFSLLQDLERYKDAANILAGLNMEGSAGGRCFTDAEKADVFVRVAEAYLADDEADSAENFLNKASLVMQGVEDPVLDLRYRTTSARVLDSNRKFLDAAVRFYDLSQTSKVHVDQQDLLELLGRAITCAILGKAGPQRSRILGMLFKVMIRGGS